MTEYYQLLKEYIREEDARKTFDKVFDTQTIEAVRMLAQKGYIDHLEFVISTGKEAHVFRAMDPAGNYRAVKIYKVKTTNFNKMIEYLEGDERFTDVKKNRREIINQWTKKEYKNLEKMNTAGIRTPLPIAFKGNVLVMEFIGTNGEPSHPLQEQPMKDVKKLHERVVMFMASLIGKAGLVHADLSEYNILNCEEEPVLIDCAQAVLLSHPKAKRFFERDIKNMSKYLTNAGYKISHEELYAEIKKLSEKM